MRQRGKIGTGVPSLERLRVSASVIDRGTVCLVDAGLSVQRIALHRIAMKTIGGQLKTRQEEQTYLAVIEYLADALGAYKEGKD